MKKSTLTPEQAWSKIIELKEAIEKAEDKEYQENLPYGTLSDAVSDELINFLNHIAEEPNAESIYLFCLRQRSDNKIHTLDDDELQGFAGDAINKPYAEKVLTAVMTHPKFRGFEDEIQLALLEKPSLLVTYWQNGHDLSDDAELAICALPNWKELLTKYFAYGHGLCAKAQRKIFDLPKEQALKLVAKFISGITKENYYKRALCNCGFFFLLKNRPLFDLYVEKMTPFYRKKQDALPQTIAFVARRKGWL